MTERKKFGGLLDTQSEHWLQNDQSSRRKGPNRKAQKSATTYCLSTGKSRAAGLSCSFRLVREETKK